MRQCAYELLLFVSDYVEIAGFGIVSTPGVVIDGKVVDSGGLPKAEDVAKWLAI